MRKTNVAFLLCLFYTFSICAQDLTIENAMLRQRVIELERQVAQLQAAPARQVQPHPLPPVQQLQQHQAIVLPIRARTNPLHPHEFQASGHFRRLSHDYARQYSSAAGIGYTYRFADWFVGASFAYENATWSYKYSAVGDIERESSITTIYGGYESRLGWDVSMYGAIGFMSMRPDSSSYPSWSIPGETIEEWSPKKHKEQIRIGLEIGSTITFAGLDIRPHLGVDYSYSPTEHYHYYASANRGVPEIHQKLHLTDKRHQIEVPFGVSIKKDFAFGAWSATPYLDMILVHGNEGSFARSVPVFTNRGWRNMGNGSGVIAGRFNAGSTFSYRSLHMGIDYTLETRKDTTDHTVSAIAGLSF